MTPPSPYREQVVLHSTLQSAVPFVTITTLWLAAHGLAGSPSPHCRGGFRHGSASGPHACSPSHRPTPGRVPKPKRSTHALLGARLVLVDGHLRADLDADAEVPVLVVDLDEDEAGQVLATLDPLAAMAEANTEALSKLLQEVTVPIDLGDLFPSLPGLVPEPPPAPDDVVEPVADPITKRGDVWQLGRHRLMCGDSAVVEDVVWLLDGVTCDLVLTDPPYLLTGISGGGIAGTERMYRSGILDPMMAFDFDAHKDVLMNHAPMLIAFHSRDQIPQYAALASATKRTYDLHVWHKTNSPPFTHHTWKSDLEYIALLWHKKPGWKQVDQSRCSKLFQSPTISDDGHPTVKPLELLERYIEILDALRVFDPFVGSGTTILAAERQHRACYAMEIAPGYVDAAVKRWEAYTGEKGVRLCL